MITLILASVEHALWLAIMQVSLSINSYYERCRRQFGAEQGNTMYGRSLTHVAFQILNFTGCQPTSYHRLVNLSCVITKYLL